MSTTPITTLRTVSPTPAGLVWENPPEKTPTGQYADIAAALRDHPSRWALIKTFPTAQAKRGWTFSGAIRTGKLVDFRGGGFEAKARSVDGQVRVYARFVGAAQAGVETSAVAR